MAGRKKKAKEEKSEPAAEVSTGGAPAEKAGSAFAAATAGMTMISASEAAEAMAIADASDLELQSIEKRPGDRWENGRLLERVINADLTEEADVPIPLEDYQARSERMASATEMLLDILPREKATALAVFRERKAKLEEECDMLRKQVQHHTERRQVPIEQIAIYPNGDGTGGVMIWRMKEGERKIIRQRPLDTEEKQSALPLSQRTKKPAKEKETEVHVEGEEAVVDNGPAPRGSMAWALAGCPGEPCLPGHHDKMAELYLGGLKHIETTYGRSYYEPAELDFATKNIQEKIAAIAKGELDKPKPAPTAADGGVHEPVKRYREDPEKPGFCVAPCGASAFDHAGISETCPAPKLSLVQ